ncbi:MAG: polyribonucleotide nucleotidyltransferase [Candidatus Moeniiplasma glomeromycotorum]|nr:polyribonucleotide nucleotidyltransferase [Candidatus Moeniiplasma glomeromycotorum]MCE8168456.1 polyribonucleotide nucleotidyltransferase [Candidatus Moeniiplasma glomeromycotorum]MCE8169580.1 polyribonucleotide nucleotidyltransferase [Candidatus Moeniiplasma glomeromycotorum]
MNKNETYDKVKNQAEAVKNFSNSRLPLSSKKRFEFNFRNQPVVFEIDHLATKSDKSILCRYGGTTVLTVLTVKQLSKTVSSFFHLSISFEEKFYAVGRIPGSFTKREGRPSYDAVTAARLIDRSLRSFFPFPNNQEVQITILVLTVNQKNDPRVAAAWNSILVCLLSPLLPYFQTPLATVIVGKEKGKLVCNPSREVLDRSPLELIVSASEEKIVMLEAGGQEISEIELLGAIDFAQQEIKLLIGFFQQIVNSLGIKKKTAESTERETVSTKELEEKINFQLENALSNPHLDWIEKEKKFKECRQEIAKEYGVKNSHLEEEYIKDLTEQIWDNCLRNWMRKLWKENQVRLDGRGADQIRPLEIEIDYLPEVHGSAVFKRGGTEVLSAIAIGKLSEKQLVDSIFSRSHKYFIHHYNFPPFAVNEIVSYRGISRREIGHGELVEKTFDYLLPDIDIFPHTVRVVSEVSSSDGSSSQAAICATSLALMTAGVPLTRPAAGIALGLFEGQIYTDINGLEDKLGEMDFKIAGTEIGICSLQLDLKNKGINLELIPECFTKARSARLFLLTEMKKYIECPRSTLPAQVIKCRRFYVAKEKIGLIVGPGGRTIKQLTETTGSTIEIQDDSYILIYHPQEEKLAEIWRIIQNLIE